MPFDCKKKKHTGMHLCFKRYILQKEGGIGRCQPRYADMADGSFRAKGAWEEQA